MPNRPVPPLLRIHARTAFARPVTTLPSRRLRRYWRGRGPVHPCTTASAPPSRLLLGSGLPVQDARICATLPRERGTMECCLPFRRVLRHSADCLNRRYPFVGIGLVQENDDDSRHRGDREKKTLFRVHRHVRIPLRACQFPSQAALIPAQSPRISRVTASAAAPTAPRDTWSSSPTPGGASTHLDTFVLGVDERPQFAYFEPNCSFEVADVPMMVFGADRTRAPECWNQLLVQHRTAAPSGVTSAASVAATAAQCPACRGTCGRDWQTRRGSRCCGRSR